MRSIIFFILLFILFQIFSCQLFAQSPELKGERGKIQTDKIYPLQAEIIGISPKNILIDKGSQDGIKENMEFIIKRGEKIIGRVKVIKVHLKSAEVYPISVLEGFQIEFTDMIEICPLNITQTKGVPQIETEIIGISPRNIWIDAGENLGLKEGMELSIIRDKGIIGKVRIKSIKEKRSEAIPISILEGYEITLSDKAVYFQEPPRITKEKYFVLKDEQQNIPPMKLPAKSYSKLHTTEKPQTDLKNKIPLMYQISKTEKDIKTTPIKEFPNVQASLPGGLLTSFSYSGKGIDLSNQFKDFDIKLLAKQDEVDANILQRQDVTPSDYFLSDLPSYYEKEKFSCFNTLIEPKMTNQTYNLIGVNLGFDLGGFQIKTLFYIKPPKKKKKIICGANIKGPYYLNTTTILAGSEKIKINGKEQKSEIDYTINYSKGEINFTNSIPYNTEIIIEYDIAQSQTQEPGKFQGLRIQTKENKRSTISTFGFSFFKDEMISYNLQNETATSSLLDHSLIGFDTKLNLSPKHTLALEFARSTGDKSKKIGKFHIVHFAINDSKSQTKDPQGPYYLPSDKLPIIEGTDEVRINNTLLERDQDYYLDGQDGRLIIKKKDLSLTEFDNIEVRYRYLPENILTKEEKNVKDKAYLLSAKFNFGRIKYNLDYQKYGENFLQVGNIPNTNILSTHHSLELNPSSSFTLRLNKDLKETLDSQESKVKTTNEIYGLNANLKLNRKTNISYQLSQNKRYDNKETKDIDTQDTNHNIQTDYKFNSRYKISLRRIKSTNISLNNDKTQTQKDYSNVFILNSKPLRNLFLDANLTYGNSIQERDEDKLNTYKINQKYKARFIPLKTLFLNFDYEKNIFKNSLNTKQRNYTRKTGLNYTPTKDTSFLFQNQIKFNKYLNNEEKQNLNQFSLNSKILNDLNTQLSINTLSIQRPTYIMDTIQNNVTFQYSPNWPKKLIFQTGYSLQKSKAQVFTLTTVSTTKTESNTKILGISGSPIWRDQPLLTQVSFTRNIDLLNPDLNTKEKNYKFQIGIPFIYKSSFKLDYSITKRRGGQSINQKEFSLALQGGLLKELNISLLWKTQSFDYQENKNANRKISILTLITSFNKKF